MLSPVVSAYLNDIVHLQETKTSEPASAPRQERSLPARDDFVLSNLKFVIKIAREYLGRGLPFEDLISEGNYGLIVAARRYDPSRGVKFSAYAVWWIRHAILNALYLQAPLIRLPSSKVKLGWTVQKVRRTLSQKLERDPTDEDIATRAKVPVRKVRRTNWSHTFVSLDGASSEAEDCTLHDLLPDPNQDAPDEAFLHNMWEDRIKAVLSRLDTREERVIHLYFGIGEERKHSLEEIGTQVGIVKERVRQIKDLALRKMRRDVLRSPFYHPKPT